LLRNVYDTHAPTPNYGTGAGKATFMAIPMDDFQMILGMEF
jgi:hypothetical protein